MELIKSSSSRMLLTLVTTHRQAGLRGFAASYEGMQHPYLNGENFTLRSNGHFSMWIFIHFEQLFVAVI